MFYKLVSIGSIDSVGIYGPALLTAFRAIRVPCKEFLLSVFILQLMLAIVI